MKAIIKKHNNKIILASLALAYNIIFLPVYLIDHSMLIDGLITSILIVIAFAFLRKVTP